MLFLDGATCVHRDTQGTEGSHNSCWPPLGMSIPINRTITNFMLSCLLAFSDNAAPDRGEPGAATHDHLRSPLTDCDNPTNPRIFGQAKPLIEQTDHARVHNPVNDTLTLAARAENATIG